MCALVRGRLLGAQGALTSNDAMPKLDVRTGSKKPLELQNMESVLRFMPHAAGQGGFWAGRKAPVPAASATRCTERRCISALSQQTHYLTIYTMSHW